jgi:ferredoxin
MKRLTLRIDPIACDGHGLCAELFPERIELDEWGYPIIADEAIGPELRKHAQRAVAACPTLALRLERAAVSRRDPGLRMAK